VLTSLRTHIRSIQPFNGKGPHPFL
jgi:hypothetical protein